MAAERPTADEIEAALAPPAVAPEEVAALGAQVDLILGGHEHEVRLIERAGAATSVKSGSDAQAPDDGLVAAGLRLDCGLIAA